METESQPRKTYSRPRETAHPILVTFAEASELVGETEMRLRSEARAGRLKVRKFSAKTIRVGQKELTRWVKKGRGRPRFTVQQLMEQPTVYRLYGRGDVLLYIGSTQNIGSRLLAHARTQPWWSRVLYVTTETFKTTAAADVAESDAIWNEKPRFNLRDAAYDQVIRTHNQRRQWGKAK